MWDNIINIIFVIKFFIQFWSIEWWWLNEYEISINWTAHIFLTDVWASKRRTTTAKSCLKKMKITKMHSSIPNEEKRVTSCAKKDMSEIKNCLLHSANFHLSLLSNFMCYKICLHKLVTYMQKLKITNTFWDGLENEFIYGAVNVVTFIYVFNSAFHSKHKITIDCRSMNNQIIVKQLLHYTNVMLN